MSRLTFGPSEKALAVVAFALVVAMVPIR